MPNFQNATQLVKAIKESMGNKYNRSEAEQYAGYCYDVKTKRKNNQLVNAWFQNKTTEELETAFRKVSNEGLVFDGKHITWQSTGISYDYVAYKNKMLLAYPDSKIDLSLVYEGDGYSFSKVSGEVNYTHKVSDPFNQQDKDIIGGYCVIRNERGEFLTTLSKAELDKHRNIAKTDFIWKQWYREMCLKTIIKKACKFHFEDIFETVEEMDNENYELPKEEVSEKGKNADRIRVALEAYKGDDKEDIRKICLDKFNSNELTDEFTENILNKIK